MRARNYASFFPCLAKFNELEVYPESVTPATVVVPSAVPVVTVEAGRRPSVKTVIVNEARRMPVVVRRRSPIVMIASVARAARINIAAAHDVTGTADSYADSPRSGACCHWCYGEREPERSEGDFGDQCFHALILRASLRRCLKERLQSPAREIPIQICEHLRIERVG